MTILTRKRTWRRDPSTRRLIRSLTPEQQANVRRALTILRRRLGLRGLASALGITSDAVTKAKQPSRPQSPRLALITARVAECSVDDILTATWPPPVTCPRCKGCGQVPA